MPNGIDGIGFTPQTHQPAQDAGAAAPLVGQRSGQQVVVQSQASLVQNSLEELPANLSDKKSTDLSKRTARSRSSSRAMELARKYVKAVAGVSQPEKFEKLAEALKKLGNPTPEQLKDLLSKEFKDNESSALLFLEELLSAEGGQDAALSVVREVKAELGTQLREFAQSTLTLMESFGETFQQLLGDHDEKSFLEAAELMIKKVGLDLHANSAEMEPAQLKATVDTLYHLEMTRNTYLAFDQLAERMESSFDLKLPNGGHGLMESVLPLKDDRWVDGNKVNSTIGKLQVTADAPKIYMLRELYSLAGRLPDKVYNDNEDRLRLTGAVQEALNTAIDEEVEE